MKIFHNISRHKKIFLSDKREFFHGFLGILAVIVLMYGGTRLIGLENIQSKVGTLAVFGPIMFVLLKASTIIFAPLSGGPLYIAAGPLFGFGRGLIYITAGDILGNSAAFFISRFFGRKIIRRLLWKAGVKIGEEVVFHITTIKGLVCARAAFIGFPEAVSYAAGLTDISFWRFIFISEAIAIIPRTLLVFSGAILMQKAFTALAVITVGSLAAAFLGIKFMKKIGNRRQED